MQTAAAESKVKIRELIIPASILRGGQKFEFGRLGVSSENIFAELIWFPVGAGNEVKLAWQVFIAPQNTSDYWLIRVDALTNTVISKENLTVSCNWGDQHHSPKDHLTENNNKIKNYVALESSNKITGVNQPYVVNNATYRVVPYPAESPDTSRWNTGNPN